MAVNFLTRRWRTIAIVVSCIFIAILISLLFLDSYLTPKLSEKLKNAVIKGSDSLYNIDFSKAKLHILKGNAVLYDITLKPDMAVYRQLQQKGTAPAEVYQLLVKQLVITDAHPFKLYFHKQLDIGQIIIDTPQVQISRFVVKNDTIKKATGTLYSKLASTFKFIHVGSIKLSNIHTIYKDNTKAKSEILVLKELNLTATDLLIDSATQTDQTRSLFCRDITTDLHHFKWNTADGLYQFKVNTVHLSTRYARLTIAGAQVLPIPARAFFANDKKKWDRYTLRLDSVILNNFNYQKFRKQGAFDAAHLIVKNGYLEIYSNPNGQPKKTDRIVTYPNYFLRHMSLVLSIDTIDVKHADVILTMFNKRSAHSGTIQFKRTTARFLNVTNKPTVVRQHPNSMVNLTTYVMGKARLDAAFIFSLTNPAYSYSYKGHLRPVSLLEGNSAMVPLSLMEIKSGTENSLDFNIHSNQKISAGKVTFLYNNLKIALLRHDDQKGYAKKPLNSLLANLVIVKNNNPDDNHTAPRSANVVYVRPLQVPFFASLWQTIFSGIKSCAEFGKAQEKTANKSMTKEEQKAEAKALKKAEKKAEKEEKRIKKQQEKAAKQHTN